MAGRVGGGDLGLASAPHIALQVQLYGFIKTLQELHGYQDAEVCAWETALMDVAERDRIAEGADSRHAPLFADAGWGAK